MALLNTNIGPERVQVFDVPVGVVQIPGAATSVTAFLISSSFGGAPVNVPTTINSLEELEAVFGGPDDILNEAYYAIQGYYDNAGIGATAIIVNVGTSPNAASYIGSASNGTGLRALDPIDVVGLVCVPGLPLSQAYLVHPALIDYSETVRAEFGATLSTSFSLLSMPRQITKANTRATFLSAQLLASGAITGLVVSLQGSPVLANVTPGMVVYKASTFIGTITAVNDTADTITLTSVTGLADNDMITIEIPTAIVYKDQVVNNPSRVSAWYFNNVSVVDRSDTPPSPTVVVDPVGHIAGVIGRIDANIAIGGPSHAPAGIKFAGLAGIVGLSFALSERLDAAPLRLAFINRLQEFPGSGRVIFGGYSAGGSAVTASEQLIQVMRTLQYIKASLEPGLRGFIWENFSPETQSEVERAINSFLSNNIHLFPAGLPQDQQFRVLRVEPTQDELDQGLLRVRVLVRPNTAVRFIEIALEFPLPTSN
jgi:hypothetical protein